jgi:hypothetical protein
LAEKSETEIDTMIETSLESSSLQRKKKLFVFVTILCVAIPGFAALKALCILCLWAYTTSVGSVRTGSIVWFLSVILNVAFCCEVAFLHDVPPVDTGNQLSRVVLFFLSLGVGASIADSQVFDRRTTDKLILWLAFISAILKVLILGAILSGRITLEAAQKGLGFETVTDDIGFGLQRLQFPSDIALIFFVACYFGGRRKLIDILFLLSITISVFLSFSRYLFAAYALCLVIRFVRVKKLDTVSVAALSSILIIGAIFSVTLFSRFSSRGAQDSDSTRTEQIAYLTEVIVQHPFFGTGMGSSINGYKRSGTIPFSYEVQWYALAMQFGFLGLAWFLVNMVAPLSICCKSPRKTSVFLVVFLLWLLAGFTNPFIISLGSAFGLSILMLSLTNEISVSSPHSTLRLKT